MSTHTRKSLVDVLNGTSRDQLARQFAEAEAAGDMLPLPRGTYRCRVTDGELVASKGGTPGYSLTFTVDDGEHKGRKLWHTAWLTPAALPMLINLQAMECMRSYALPISRLGAS